MDATFVYVLAVDVYEDRHIEGVYATARAAMAAHAPVPKGDGHWYEWTGPDSDGLYDFDGSGRDAAEIVRFEVQS